MGVATPDYIYGTDILTTPPGFRDEAFEYIFTYDYLPIGGGGPATNPSIPLVTDSDADFIARAVRGSTVTLAPGAVANGEVGGDVAIRWTNVNQLYLQHMPARLNTLVGTATCPRKLTPCLIIPAGGVIYLDVNPIDQNFTANGGFCRLFLGFIGVKRYPSA
jgi:hypothetical protein